MKTVFLDRDGTIIIDKNYLSDPSLVELENVAGEGLALLQEAGFQLIGVTNQSGVGRGYFGLDSVVGCNQRVDELLSAFGVKIATWLVCPHSPEERCSCRKPMTGLIDKAASRFKIDSERSFVVGDKDSDLMLAKNAKLNGILVLTGSGKMHIHAASTLKFPYAKDLLAAARLIICSEQT